MLNLESILAELSFILPDVSVSDINILEMMDFDLHNLPDQFKKDLLYTSFFSMLEIEIKHKVAKEENALKDLENDLNESLRINATEKYTEARLKILVQKDTNYRSKRDAIETLQYQLNSVAQIVKDLSRKGIALNVLTAKTRAEIGAAISH
jgi:hypothetical protein